MHAEGGVRARAKRLRRMMTLPQVKLWFQLRANRLEGLHFRRQHPEGRYILDFYCDRARLCVEVDGYILGPPTIRSATRGGTPGWRGGGFGRCGCPRPRC